MGKRYICLSGDLYGNWGCGDSVEAAKRNLRKAGGKVKGCRVVVFTSDLPFAPSDRPATDGEADCWVGRDGSINWLRCQKEEVTAA